MSNSYNSILVTLQELVQGSKDKNLETNIKFNIPIYQRLYVWKEEQVKKLLEDTYNAYIISKENPEIVKEELTISQKISHTILIFSTITFG